jgi:hypothetical protein
MANRKFVILAAVVAFASITSSLIIISINQFNQITETEDRSNNFNKIELDEESLFIRSTDKDAFVTKNGKKIWYSLEYKLKPELSDVYDEIGVINDTQNTIVVFPIFTVSAHSEMRNFDYYYLGICDIECLTVQITFDLRPDSGGDVAQILNLLGYKFISDADLDKNPGGLSKYDKVILLQNEYVTKNEFDALTNHPHVLYLFPNVLLGHVNANYEKNTITLVQGKDYPQKGIVNGFGWKYNNFTFSDSACDDWKFIKVDNGMMLNCNPTDILHNDKQLLKFIKDF